MKIFFVLVSILLFTNDIIKTDSIDGVKIGMSIQEFLKLKKENRIVKKEKISLEGDDYDIYNVYKDKKILYGVEPQCEKECNVWRIWVYSKDFKTKENIGIGNKLGDLKKKYTISEFITGEGRVAILVKEINISFLLDSSRIPDSWWSNQSLENLNDELKIVVIIIT